jgi:acid stress chaperone HdeB
MTRSIRYIHVMVWVAFAFTLGPAPVARAQVTLEVSKLTCEQLVNYKIATSEKIAMWLSGYHSGKTGNTSLNAQELSGSARKLRSYCARNGQMLVMEAVEAVVATRKK